MPLLPTDPAERKKIPIGTGVLDYFPDALAEVAKASLAGNKQHANGEALHWDRSKSQDESDALIRHFLERDKMDEDGVLHAGKMAWRALAYTQKLCEARKEAERKETPESTIQYLRSLCSCAPSSRCLVHGE